MPNKRPGSSRTGELFDRKVYGRRTSGAASSRARRGRKKSRGSVSPLDPIEIEETPKPAPAPTELFYDEPFRDFEYVYGTHLTGSILWFDCERRRDLTFLSHAHADFVGKNRRILATDKTLKLLTRRSGKVDALTSPYKRGFTLGPLRLEMHPAGHVLGSAQLLIERDQRRLLYTSDVCTRPSATVEKARPVECDVLAIPATFGHPSFRFPSRQEVLQDLRTFIEEAFEQSATPVLLAEQLGLAQEVTRQLADMGFKIRVHGSIYDIAKVYKELGVTMPNTRRFQGTPARDEVVVFPPVLKKHASIRKLKKAKKALLTGHAVEPGFALQNRVDAAFPFSNVADHAELLSFIEQTGAYEVYLTGGYIDEFGAELRDKGYKVYSLVPPKQLSLL